MKFYLSVDVLEGNEVLKSVLNYLQEQDYIKLVAEPKENAKYITISFEYKKD